MKRPDHNAEESVKTFLDSLGNPPQATIEAARGRLIERLRAGDQLPPFEVEETPRRQWSPWVMAAVAASLLAAVVGIVAFRDSPDSFVAVAESQAKIRIGEPVRSPSGMKLTLTDGSLLNMRPGSELSFYRAADDLCIQLVRGDLVVNAAKQEAGRHLCLQTKDFTVTVIGTVFTVSVEARGSSVIVREGTVWVQQGSIKNTLMAGQQFSTIAAEATPQISALTAPLSPQGAQAPPQARATAKPSPQSFEVISIKKMPPNPDDDRPHRRAMGPGGWRATNVTLKDLVLEAYDLPVFRLSGGPAWIDKDRFEVETKFGSDASAWIERIMSAPSDETRMQFFSMAEEMMQDMMQDMLATRFKLKVRRTTEQTSAYALVLSGKTSKLKPGEVSGPISADPASGRYKGLGTMAELAKFLSGAVGQPVVDRTGLPGIYDVELHFVPEAIKEKLASLGDIPGAGGDGGGRGGPGGRGGRGGGPGIGVDGPDLRSALQDQLGLKLETTKAPVEFLVIESVEQPSEN